MAVRSLGRSTWAALGSAALLCAGCASAHTHSPTPSPSSSSSGTQQTTLRVHAQLTYSHPAPAGQMSHDGPMRGEKVTATDESGQQLAADTAIDGWATLHPAPGRYGVRVPACPDPPRTVTIRAHQVFMIQLICVAP